MKKSLIAFAIFGAFAASASAQSSVTIYGIIDAAVVHTTNQTVSGDSKTSLDAGQLGTSRWGIKGTEDLGGGLKATFDLEGTMANDTGGAGAGYGALPAPVGGFTQSGSASSLFDREATVGLTGNFGSLKMGRQNMAGLTILGMADPISLAHAGSNPNVVYGAMNSGTLFGNWGTNGGGSALRQNNSVKYVTPIMSGFGASAMYGFGEKAGDTSPNSYLGGAAFFTDGKSGVAIAYSELTDATDSSTLKTIGGGGRLKMEVVTLRATYVENEVDGGILNNRKIAVLGAGVDFSLSPTTTLTGAYYNTKMSGSSAQGNGKADQYIGIAKYAFSKRTIAYASYTYAQAGAATVSDQMMSGGIIPTGSKQDDANRFAVGVQHSF